MLLLDKASKVKKSEEFEGDDFRIAPSSVAFRILSSGLYSNKIRSIIRELSTNAYDSHVMKGTDIPFEVTLPTAYEQTFKIRDFGIGLTPEQIRDVYRNYFVSDKNDSNDYVGCMGLGAKSPFSYVDKFNVVSFVNEQKYVYTAYISESGRPRIDLLHKEDTTEQEGLLVEFSVKPVDFQTFEKEALDIYRYFKVQPILKNNRSKVKPLEYTDETIILGKSVKARKYIEPGWENNYGTEPSLQVIMGNVAYPVKDIQESGWSELATKICGRSIDIYVDIGDVAVTASRESLEYKPPVIKLLRDIVKGLTIHIKDKAQTEIDKCKSIFEACMKYPSIQGNWCNVLTMYDLSYKGKPLSSTFQLKEPLEEVTKPYGNKNRYRTTQTIRLDHNIKFITNDVKDYKARCSFHLESNKETLYVCESDKVDSIKKQLDIDDSYFTLASNLPKKPRAKGVGRGVAKEQFFLYSVGGYGVHYSYWKEKQLTDMEIKAGGFYLEICNNKWRIGERELEPNKLAQLLKWIGLENQVFYGIKTVAIKKIEKLKQWKRIADVINTEFIKYLTKNSVSQIEKDQLVSFYEYKHINNILINFRRTKDFPILHDIKEELEQVENNIKVFRYDEMSILKECITHLGIDTKQFQTKDRKLKDKLKNIYTKYPLLEYLQDCPESVLFNYLK